MGVCIKWLTHSAMPSSEVAFFRSLGITLVLLGWSWSKDINIFGTQHKLLLLRGLLGTIALFCMFFAISAIPLANAMALSLCSPIFVILFAALFLRERMSKQEIIWVLVAFGGALMVIQPGTSVFQWSSLAALCSAILAGAAYTLVRHLSKTESNTSIIFVFAWMSTLFGVPLMWNSFVMPQGTQWLWLLGVILSALLGQVFLTLAYAAEEAGPVSALTYLGVLFSGLWGFLIWDEQPNGLSLLGAVTLMFACATISWKRFQAKKRTN